LAKPLNSLSKSFFLAAALSLGVNLAWAAEEQRESPGVFSSAMNSAQDLVINAMSHLGIAYRRGGTSPETGFDCSGFVRHVYQNTIGMLLPRTAADMASRGQSIAQSELQPGDLVFFNTLRRTFSHVGIYVGEGKFVHAPSSGGQVRVESMSVPYWRARFDGARRIEQSTQAQAPARIIPAGMRESSQGAFPQPAKDESKADPLGAMIRDLRVNSPQQKQ
jgi:cell wall-associated NlpC family hydrolase